MFKKFGTFFLLFFLIIVSAFGEDNPKLIGYPSNKIMGFLGLDSRSRAPLLADGRATDLLNVVVSPTFDLRRRYGYSIITGNLDDTTMDDPDIEGIFDAEFSNGTSYTFVFVGNKLKYDNTTSWVDVTGGGAITAGQDNQWQCLMALDTSICTNNVDTPLEIDNAPNRSILNFTGLSSSVTRAKAHIWYQNYMIWGNTTEGGTARPTRFRWSNVGTTETYSDDDRVDIASLNGDEIIAFKEMYGDLYIIMRKSIWKASLVGGNDIFVFSKLVDSIGAIARNSVQVVTFPDNKLGIVFLSEDKRMYVFNGVAVLDLGWLIQPTLDNLVASRLPYAVSVFDGEYYHLSVATGSSTYNDLVLGYNPRINEWIKSDQINANAFTRVTESTSLIKTYFGNYNSFVYWLDNSDNLNDVDGATGSIDSLSTQNNQFMTGAQMIVDAGITSGAYTGAIMKITSGTGAGQERVIMSGAITNVIVTVAFTTSPDSTSLYSIGDINAYYFTKHYDMGDSSRFKGFRKSFIWGAEDSDNSVDVGYALDYGSVLNSETLNLSPSSTSLWDSAIWDESIWGTTGDKFYTTDLTGHGRSIQLRFSQDDIDETFHLYGYHILADSLDRE